MNYIVKNSDVWDWVNLVDGTQNLVTCASANEKVRISIFFQRMVLGNGNQAVPVGYAKPTWNMLALYNKDVWHLNNIFICVIYMLSYLYVI